MATGKLKSLHSIEVNLLPVQSSDFSFKLDGKEVKGIRNVKIECGIEKGKEVPIVKLEIIANEVIGKIKGKLIIRKVK